MTAKPISIYTEGIAHERVVYEWTSIGETRFWAGALCSRPSGDYL